jgi:hypothetical protein
MISTDFTRFHLQRGGEEAKTMRVGGTEREKGKGREGGRETTFALIDRYRRSERSMRGKQEVKDKTHVMHASNLGVRHP